MENAVKLGSLMQSCQILIIKYLQDETRKGFFRKKKKKKKKKTGSPPHPHPPPPPNQARVVILVDDMSSRPVLHFYQESSKYCEERQSCHSCTEHHLVLFYISTKHNHNIPKGI